MQSAVTRPEFMTMAMWFAWMLRGDVRGAAAVGDLEGQRDFVCWWLCFGGTEYPAVWWYGQDQLTVAMEDRTTAGVPLLPRLLRYIVHSRPDLAQEFIQEQVLDLAGLICWYQISAPSELSAAPPLPLTLIELSERPCPVPPWNQDGTEVSRMAVELWKRSDHLQRRWPSNNPAARIELQNWFRTAGAKLVPTSSRLPLGPEPLPPSSTHAPSLTQGVNLIGYPRGELGIGEDVRMLSASLDAAGIEHVILDVPFGPLARREDDSVAARVVGEPRYPITILCLTAFDTADLYLRTGSRFLSAAYRIGNWPWELPRFPDAWQDAYLLVDEVWAASRYTMDAYRYNAGATPLRLMPPAVVAAPVHLTQWRRGLANPDAFVFLMPFDPHSTFRRKNPLAAIKAFRQAFDPNDSSVALLLRVNGDPSAQPGWTDLQAAAAGDDRIRCTTLTLSRPEALGILRDADCLLSPHRAEGFGRNIAEAKLLGTPVLATGFSGNMDFTGPSERIAWQRTALQPGDYPHGDGLWWAEPCIDDMVNRMRAIRHAPARQNLHVKRVAGLQSARQAGRRYAARIAEVAVSFEATGPNASPGEER